MSLEVTLIELDRLIAQRNSAAFGDIVDLMTKVGATVGNLSELVRRYGALEGTEAPAAIAFTLSRRTWDVELAEEGLGPVVIDFLRLATRQEEREVLSGALGSLHALCARGLLASLTTADQDAISHFLTHCLNSGDTSVVGHAAYVLRHLTLAGVLSAALTPAGVEAVRKRLIALQNAELSNDLREDLAILADGLRLS